MWIGMYQSGVHFFTLTIIKKKKKQKKKKKKKNMEILRIKVLKITSGNKEPFTDRKLESRFY